MALRTRTRTMPVSARPGPCPSLPVLRQHLCLRIQGNLFLDGKTKLGETWARQDSCPTSPEPRVANGRPSLKSPLPLRAILWHLWSVACNGQWVVPPWKQTQSLLLQRKLLPLILASVGLINPVPCLPPGREMRRTLPNCPPCHGVVFVLLRDGQLCPLPPRGGARSVRASGTRGDRLSRLGTRS